jgi:predicted PurR-regulated permease PerM
MRLGQQTERLERIAQLALVGGLLVGCWLVLQPFLSAILFAIVIAVSTWPVFERLLRRMNSRRGLASLVACLTVALTLLMPAALLAVSAADAVRWAADRVRDQFAAGTLLAPPTWARSVPLVGAGLEGYWNQLAGSRAELGRALQTVADPARNLALGLGGAVGGGVLQVLAAVFLLFFFYRDGDRLAGRVAAAAERVIGPTAGELLGVAQSTVVGVMLGLVVTAVCQGLVASLGFVIAGVPGPMLLGAATFVASLIPFGPPIVWGGAAVWLYSGGQTGWAVFMAVYGLLVISSVDNFVKPLVIARTTSLPIALTLLGVIGGVVAFGFMGLFVGPTLLAVAVNLADRWLARQAGEVPPPGTPAEAPPMPVAPALVPVPEPVPTQPEPEAERVTQG